MGRTETPVDPLAGPVAEFAYELRKLRQEAGNPTYRDMARLADVSAPTLSRAASGRQLPSLGVVRAYVRACGQDPAHWEPRWRQTWELLVEQQPSGPGARPPYLGLAHFDAGDADLFFGRDELLARLRDMLGRHRLVAVVGPSGSGKSSLVRAGLVPAGTAAEIVVFTPGDHPAARLADRVVGDPPAGGRLVIVDQFEEAYTLCTARPETDGFVAALLRLAGPAPGTRVVLTIRADRFGDCAAYPGLAEALSAATLLVGPMTGAELRDAVIKPAAAVGLIVERELTARIVADVQGRPGALPMLSHTLREVWRRRQGRTLPLAAYEQVGGVRGALAGTAESLYTSLTDAQATAARQLLLRLVNPDEHGLDTRRPACPEELGAGDDVTVALGTLTEARLVTITDGQVELAHEALITGWPRLREWLDTDRESLRHHRTLTQAATAWSDLDRDPGALYRGSRLALAEQLFAPAERRADLTAAELAFLTAGIAARDDERRATARARRRLRTLWAVLTVLMVIAGGVGYGGVRTTQARHEEQTVADARRIAGLADATHGADPALAVLLSVAAYRLADVHETRSALVTSLVQPELPVIALPATSSAYTTLLTADGRTAVNLDRGRATALRLADGQVTTFPVAQGNKAMEGLTPDGRTLALTSGGSTTVWNDARGPVATLPGSPFAFGRSGRTTIRYDETAGAVIVAEVTTGRRLARLKVRGAAVAAISPDDRLVVTCPASEPAQLWAVAVPQGPPRRLRLAEPPACTAQAPASFSRDARLLALAGADGAGVWDLRSGDRIAEIDGYTQQAELSPDGAYLATRADQEITVWRVADAVNVLSYPAASQLPEALSWVDDHTIRYLEGNGVRTLDLTPVIAAVTAPAAAATVSQDGSVTAVATDDRGGYRIRFARPGAAETLSQTRLSLTPPASPSADYAPTPLVALSADGSRAVLGMAAAPGTPWQHRLLLWDVRTGRPGATLELGDGDPIAALAITPGGDRVAVTRQLRPFDDSRTQTGLEIWDTARGTRVSRLGVAPLTFNFAPDGRSIASDQGLIDVASGAVNGGSVALRLPTDFSLTAVAYRADGRQLAFDDIAGHGEIWDTQAWRLRASLRAAPADGPWPQASAGTSVDLAFSHDGTLLAVAHDTGITLWDLAGGRPLGSAIPIPDTGIRAIGFSADDRHLVVAGTDAVRTVPVEPAALARILCDRAGRDLTRDEWNSYLPGHRRRALC